MGFRNLRPSAVSTLGLRGQSHLSAPSAGRRRNAARCPALYLRRRHVLYLRLRDLQRHRGVEHPCPLPCRRPPVLSGGRFVFSPARCPVNPCPLPAALPVLPCRRFDRFNVPGQLKRPFRRPVGGRPCCPARCPISRTRKNETAARCRRCRRCPLCGRAARYPARYAAADAADDRRPPTLPAALQTAANARYAAVLPLPAALPTLPTAARFDRFTGGAVLLVSPCF